MNESGPRILLIGGTYRALCVLERLLERGERVVAFVGVEGGGERDFCPEILEVCDRAKIPARSGHKLAEEVVRWLEDRIRPELAIAVGANTEIPLAIGGNCRLGLLEVIDSFSSDVCPGVVLRQRGQNLITREIARPPAEEESGDTYLRMVDQIVECLDDYLDRRVAPLHHCSARVSFAPADAVEDHLHTLVSHSQPGPSTDALEAEVARYLDTNHVVAVRSGEQAFAAIGTALGIETGDEVICPGVTSQPVVNGLGAIGAKLVFADVVPGSLTIDPARVRESVTPRTRALVVSHPFGQPAPLGELYALAVELGLEVIEDGGEALGARIGDSRIGRAPCTAVFRITLGAQLPGAAPALITMSESVAERAIPLLEGLRVGDGAADLARGRVETLDDDIAARRDVARHYSSELVRYDAFSVPPTPEDALPTYAAYVLRLTRFARTSAEDLHKLLGEKGIETRRIRLPLRDREIAGLVAAENARSTGILLPVWGGITDEQRDDLLDAIFGYAIG